MPKYTAPCDALIRWLSLNLPKGALGAITGTDDKALAAALHIIQLYAYTRKEQSLVAFHAVVMCMQPKCREFAYHAIAHVMDWDDRPIVWELAHLPPIRPSYTCVGDRMARAV